MKTFPWESIFGKGLPWQETYPMLAEDVRKYLDSLPDARTLSTADIADAIWPAAARANHVKAAAAFFRALDAIAQHDCYSYVSYEMDTNSTWAVRKGKALRRKRWHRCDPSKAKVAPSVAEAVVKMTGETGTDLQAALARFDARLSAIEAKLNAA